jgi:threonine synthase
VLVSWLKAAGVKSAVEDSSGNAGSSFAAYAAGAGIDGRIFIPASASGPKRIQIESYGGEVIPIPGPRSKAAEAVLEEVEEGAIYASHAYLPQGTAGIATIAYELVEQIGNEPGSILVPVGHGSLLLGVYLGFQALHKSGAIKRIPKMIGIQSAEINPLARAFRKGTSDPIPVQDRKTLAEGVSISDPYHGREVLSAVYDSGGSFLDVADEGVLAGQQELARCGLYVELTSALVWQALEQTHQDLPEPIICVITGHGLKSVRMVA